MIDEAPDIGTMTDEAPDIEIVPQFHYVHSNDPIILSDFLFSFPILC